MFDATARSEIIRRIFAGDLPIVVDFVVTQVQTGDALCKGCGLGFSAGQARCVIDSATASLGPFPMHADCFFAWAEACMRTVKHEEHTGGANGVRGASLIDDLPPSRQRVKTTMFCPTRLEMLANRVRGAHDFADAVRRLRKSGAAAARAACEEARRQSRLAREVYEEHVRDHGC